MMDSMNPWYQHEDALNELKQVAADMGLRVEVDPDVGYPDAQLFLGDSDQLVTWVWYDPVENLWTAGLSYRFYCSLDEVANHLEDLVQELPVRRRRQVLVVEYEADAPALPEGTLDAVRSVLPGAKTVTVQSPR